MVITPIESLVETLVKLGLVFTMAFAIGLERVKA
jgi:hypothetical protein